MAAYEWGWIFRVVDGVKIHILGGAEKGFWVANEKGGVYE